MEMEKHFREKDFEAFSKIYTPDCRFMPNGAPFEQGREGEFPSAQTRVSGVCPLNLASFRLGPVLYALSCYVSCANSWRSVIIFRN